MRIVEKDNMHRILRPGECFRYNLEDWMHGKNARLAVKAGIPKRIVLVSMPYIYTSDIAKDTRPTNMHLYLLREIDDMENRH